MDAAAGWRDWVAGYGWGVSPPVSRRRMMGRRGVAGGAWGWLLGRRSACSRLRCGAQPWGGGAELTALCRGQSSVQTAAPNLMLKCA